jgi:hypothetical protein
MDSQMGEETYHKIFESLEKGQSMVGGHLKSLLRALKEGLSDG